MKKQITFCLLFVLSVVLGLSVNASGDDPNTLPELYDSSRQATACSAFVLYETDGEGQPDLAE